MAAGDIYPYSKGRLLQQPNTYFYTQYHGAAFIQAWQQSRQPSDSKQAVSQPASDIARRVPSADKVDTVNLLHDLLAQQADHDYWWPRLVKKFEVSKRLFSAYQTQTPHRPAADSDYNDLDVYLLFAQWLSQAYQHYGKLQMLNTLLKVMDTLMSQQTGMMVRQQVNLNWLVQQEQQWVNGLQQAVMS